LQRQNYSASDFFYCSLPSEYLSGASLKRIEHILDGCKELPVRWVAVELERPVLLSTVEAQSKILQSLV